MRYLVILGLGLALASPAFAQKGKKPKVPAAPSAATMKAGELVYQKNCLTCHQADGSGVPMLNPPLTSKDWVLGPKPRLINVVLKGLSGQKIDGQAYHNPMPAHYFLTDREVADVLTYIRNSFGNRGSEVTPLEVKKARKP